MIASILFAALAGCASDQQIHKQAEHNGYPRYGDTDGPHDTQWYVFDDPTPHETTSSDKHQVSHHGDASLYWYEPSGAHGLVDSNNPEADFVTLSSYIRQRAGTPTFIDEPLDFSSQSTLSTFELATFTYVLCEFWVDADDGPGLYELAIEEVDDGMLVLLNSQYVDHIKLGEGGNWELNVTPGQTNAIVLILTDDSAKLRYFSQISLMRAGSLIN